MVVASIFRDSTAYLDRYFWQIDELEKRLKVPVTLCIAEGDSEDRTHSELYRRMRPQDTLLKVDHGGPKYGSQDIPDRWWRIALVCNAVMEALPADLPVIYVESDLQWETDTMVTLLDDLEDVPAVAPLSVFEGGFYDTWGHRSIDGEKFQREHPYHPDLEADASLVEISSAGSCVVMRADIAANARFGENDCIVGLGRDIKHRAGGSLWLDKRVSVFHP